MNEYFAQTLAEVLEETSTNMGNQMVLNHLSNAGSITLEESEFYHRLCTEVITEAADEFMPEELDVPEAPAPAPAEAPIELFDAVGNKYIFQNGQLIPVENEVEDDGMGEAPAPEAAPVMESTEVNETPIEESTTVETVEGEAEVVTEEEPEVLEESSQIVARILANMK